MKQFGSPAHAEFAVQMTAQEKKFKAMLTFPVAGFTYAEVINYGNMPWGERRDVCIALIDCVSKMHFMGIYHDSLLDPHTILIQTSRPRARVLLLRRPAVSDRCPADSISLAQVIFNILSRNGAATLPKTAYDIWQALESADKNNRNLEAADLIGKLISKGANVCKIASHPFCWDDSSTIAYLEWFKARLNGDVPDKHILTVVDARFVKLDSRFKLSPGHVGDIDKVVTKKRQNPKFATFVWCFTSPVLLILEIRNLEDHHAITLAETRDYCSIVMLAMFKYLVSQKVILRNASKPPNSRSRAEQGTNRSVDNARLAFVPEVSSHCEIFAAQMLQLQQLQEQTVNVCGGPKSGKKSLVARVAREFAVKDVQNCVVWLESSSVATSLRNYVSQVLGVRADDLDGQALGRSIRFELSRMRPMIVFVHPEKAELADIELFVRSVSPACCVVISSEQLEFKVLRPEVVYTRLLDDDISRLFDYFHLDRQLFSKDLQLSTLVELSVCSSGSNDDALKQVEIVCPGAYEVLAMFSPQVAIPGSLLEHLLSSEGVGRLCTMRVLRGISSFADTADTASSADSTNVSDFILTDALVFKQPIFALPHMLRILRFCRVFDADAPISVDLYRFLLSVCESCTLSSVAAMILTSFNCIYALLSQRIPEWSTWFKYARNHVADTDSGLVLLYPIMLEVYSFGEFENSLQHFTEIAGRTFHLPTLARLHNQLVRFLCTTSDSAVVPLSRIPLLGLQCGQHAAESTGYLITVTEKLVCRYKVATMERINIMTWKRAWQSSHDFSTVAFWHKEFLDQQEDAYHYCLYHWSSNSAAPVRFPAPELPAERKDEAVALLQGSLSRLQVVLGGSLTFEACQHCARGTVVRHQCGVRIEASMSKRIVAYGLSYDRNFVVLKLVDEIGMVHVLRAADLRTVRVFHDVDDCRIGQACVAMKFFHENLTTESSWRTFVGHDLLIPGADMWMACPPLQLTSVGSDAMCYGAPSDSVDQCDTVHLTSCEQSLAAISFADGEYAIRTAPDNTCFLFHRGTLLCQTKLPAKTRIVRLIGATLPVIFFRTSSRDIRFAAADGRIECFSRKGAAHIIVSPLRTRFLVKVSASTVLSGRLDQGQWGIHPQRVAAFPTCIMDSGEMWVFESKKRCFTVFSSSGIEFRSSIRARNAMCLVASGGLVTIFNAAPPRTPYEAARYHANGDMIDVVAFHKKSLTGTQLQHDWLMTCYGTYYELYPLSAAGAVVFASPSPLVFGITPGRLLCVYNSHPVCQFQVRHGGAADCAEVARLLADANAVLQALPSVYAQLDGPDSVLLDILKRDITPEEKLLLLKAALR
eukprot:TRINITY_DN2334_c1_g1_i2.p1 TRINITY_DN2334_c1_g1~~TRINITY_DN2334_c1_g1_i2.p1  ORF type:complete len:1328 (-),score=161.10 TRINITY_DN2334_c1_g1_i2:1465-5448(-)